MMARHRQCALVQRLASLLVWPALPWLCHQASASRIPLPRRGGHRLRTVPQAPAHPAKSLNLAASQEPEMALPLLATPDGLPTPSTAPVVSIAVP